MHEKTLSNLNIRLIQARTGAEMELQEQECFIERCRVDPVQIKASNVTRDALGTDLLDDIDALMIGGAGEFSAQNDYHWTEALLDLVRETIERDIPLFGSCWGHQVIARAMGGVVIHDMERAEMGCGVIELTPHAENDILFGSYPESFSANMGHHDRVLTLPEGAIELARSHSQANQAFRLAGKPVYGTQFHSELDAKRERERLLAYREYYRSTIPVEADFWKVVDGLKETTEVDHMLYDFLVKIVLPHTVLSLNNQAPSERFREL